PGRRRRRGRYPDRPRQRFRRQLRLRVWHRFRRDGAGLLSVLDQPAGLGRRERTAQHDHEGASRMSVARLKSERGQAFVLAAVAMVMCMGMAALVLDVGNWFRDKRRLQGTADAAALAGAQQLPDDSAGAASQAMSYANRNGGDVAGGDIVITSQYQPNDTITVTGRRNDPGIFTKVIAIPGAD